MKRYDRSKIMKKAWSLYKNSRNGAWAACTDPSFSECLKSAWEIEKRDKKVNAEMSKYFNEVCVEIIKAGEDAVDEAFRLWRSKSHKKAMRISKKGLEAQMEFQHMYQAHMRAWKAAISIFRSVAPTFGAELVNSKILKEFQGLEIA